MTKQEQDQLRQQQYTLYEDIRDYIEKNGSSVADACHVFGIPDHRYYWIQAKYKKDNIQRKRAKVRNKQDAKQDAKPSMTTIKYEESSQVSPELVPFPVNGDDIVFMTVSRAKNIGSILDQILQRI